MPTAHLDLLLAPPPLVDAGIETLLALNNDVDGQILALVNAHSPIAEPRTEARGYLYIEKDHRVIGCVLVVRRSWYQAEIKHLVIHPDYRRQGFAKLMLRDALAEMAKKRLRLAQSTINLTNKRSIRLFEGAGFTHFQSFSGLTGAQVGIWQKIVAPELDAAAVDGILETW